MDPDKPDRRPDSTELEYQAIDWLVWLHSGPSGAADRSLFKAWRRTSPRHEAAARDAEALWRDLGRLPRHAAERQKSAMPMAGTQWKHGGFGRRAVLGGALAAGLAVAAWGAGFFADAPDYATGTGERRTITLQDGSTVDLDAASGVSVVLGRTGRRAVLHRGRALFRIEKEAGRPFTVTAGTGEIRVLGTTFQVQRAAEMVTVTVVEGSVEVRGYKADGSAVAATRLGAGQQVSYGEQGLARATDADPAAVTAWRRGKLIFDRRPLAEVVAELERYRPGPIAILNPDVAELEVTGVFDLADPDGLLRAVESTLPVTVHRLPFLTVIR